MSGIITVTQHVGSEEYLIHYSFSESGECRMQRYVVQDAETVLLKEYTIKSTLCNAATAMIDLILVCILENNSTDDYRVTVALREKADFYNVHEMTQCLGTLIETKTDDNFTHIVETYDKIKESYYRNIICSYTFIGRNYNEFFAQSQMMSDAIRRMVNLLMTMLLPV